MRTIFHNFDGLVRSQPGTEIGFALEVSSELSRLLLFLFCAHDLYLTLFNFSLHPMLSLDIRASTLALVDFHEDSMVLLLLQ